jgi:carbon storage regulator CsrA
MLVLTRKIDESIVIGDNIVVKVIAIENGNVKLGIEAPKEVAIIRDELLQEVRRSNKEANQEVNQADLDLLSQMLKK